MLKLYLYKRLLIPFITACTLLFAVGCGSSISSNDGQEMLSQKLTISVVGESPSVVEENVEFKETTLNGVNPKDEVDALFIMSEHLKEASDGRYARLYNELSYPVFWIDSKKPYYAFTEESLTYEDAPGEFENYAYGYQYVGPEEVKVWATGLAENEDAQAAYSRIFKYIISEKSK
ncbi:hypothetical protein [Mechercharimyces sp. CAU 1602]|uniref:hypothetical protein n=1 Tax=Mechercharimyces sp. CAU 1602 TaxID=2973933 RepID=UPI00216253CC|nr:hypothetical protein [Mechercharimyces sp. CAU 1602]MCS1351685.1 hypothetical protein [Mechercharimyces sp. CAU 1602]